MLILITTNIAAVVSEAEITYPHMKADVSIPVTCKC